MALELLPFQKIGATFLTERKLAILADEMRVGKTPQAIRACDEIFASSILVICPAVARRNWAREFARFSICANDFVLIESLDEAPLEPGRSAIISYDLAARIRLEQKHKWDVCILDEAHYLKSLDAKRSQRILGKGGIARRGKRIWALTGTPMPNHMGELWPLLYTFGATRLKYDTFCERYADSKPSVFGPKPIGVKRSAIPEIRKMLEPVMLRRKLKDVMPELPPFVIEDYYIERSPLKLTPQMNAQVARELSMLNGYLDQALTDEEKIAILEGCAKSVSTLRRYIGMQKVRGAYELLAEELNADPTMKLVVFCIHCEVVSMLVSRFVKGGFNPVSISGKVPAKVRDDYLQRFQTNKNCRVFVGNIAATGIAIDLTASSEVVFVEQEWTPAANDQAKARCQGMNQKAPFVRVRMLSIPDSIDENTNGILRRKTSYIASLFN